MASVTIAPVTMASVTMASVTMASATMASATMASVGKGCFQQSIMPGGRSHSASAASPVAARKSPPARRRASRSKSPPPARSKSRSGSIPRRPARERERRSDRERARSPRSTSRERRRERTERRDREREQERDGKGRAHADNRERGRESSRERGRESSRERGRGPRERGRESRERGREGRRGHSERDRRRDGRRSRSRSPAVKKERDEFGRIKTEESSENGQARVHPDRQRMIARAGRGDRGDRADQPAVRPGGVCFEFQRKGQCERGDSCRFSHEEGKAGTAPVCFAFQKGECERGDSCRFSHDAAAADRSRRQICFKFQKGECSFGDKCRFLHDTGPEPGGRHEQDRGNWGKDDDGKGTWGGADAGEEKKGAPKEKPNFETSGALLEDEEGEAASKGLKYHEPEDAREPGHGWRLYVFKDEQNVGPPLRLQKRSMFLIGKKKKGAIIEANHPSVSGHHAIIQFRQKGTRTVTGEMELKIKPYIIDLNSTNGTFLNKKKIEGAKYYELLEGDVIKLGFSSRDYVLLHSNTKEENILQKE
eukprot:g32362.t1